MEKILNSMKKQKGYISIETIIVAGLIIGLGAISIKKFQDSGNTVTATAIKTVGDVQGNYTFGTTK